MALIAPLCRSWGDLARSRSQRSSAWRRSTRTAAPCAGGGASPEARPWVPATNNRTEQGIGKSKVRFTTTRGFGSAADAMAGTALTQWVYSGAETHDLRELVA